MSGYFLYHSIGTFPGKAERMAASLTDFSNIWSAEDDGQWPAALAARQRFIDAWRRLIEAPQGTLTTAENVTAALYSLIGGLPTERLAGKRLLVAADCFPSLHFLLAGLGERFGFTLDTVPLRPGETWVRDQDFIDRWQADVGLALITFVTSTASHRCDVGRLAAHGRAVGSIVGVDVTQGIGVAPFSVAATPVDFVVSTSLKWLCGSSGAGILQVAPDLLASCRPELRAGSVSRTRSPGTSTLSLTPTMRAASIMARRRSWQASPRCPGWSGWNRPASTSSARRMPGSSSVSSAPRWRMAGRSARRSMPVNAAAA